MNISHDTYLLTAQSQQAKELVEQLCHALQTSNKLVNALLDGNAKDKTLGRYILQASRETDALLDTHCAKKLLYLLDKSIADICRDSVRTNNFIGQSAESSNPSFANTALTDENH